MATKTYLFKPDRNGLKQGYLMQDKDENIVYEGKMMKFTLLGAAPFEFVNHYAVHQVPF